MCGIAGFVHYAQKHAQADVAWLSPVLERLQHRGPDGEGMWAEGPVALGHRRLSIIDLEGGAQPMHAQNAGVSITFNGMFAFALWDGDRYRCSTMALLRNDRAPASTASGHRPTMRRQTCH